MHGDRKTIMVNLRKQIVIVDAGIFIKIVSVPLDRICVRASAARHEIRNSAVFMALVVMYMPVEHHKTRATVLLPLFEKFC